MQGVLDIWGKVMGKPAIVDLKYSGLLYDRWNALGWDLDQLPYNDRIMIQSVQYKLLVSEELGIGLDEFDFYFLVFNQKTPRDAKFIRVVIDDSQYYQHKDNVDLVLEAVHSMDIDEDFTPVPSFKNCESCPTALRDICPFKQVVPEIVEVYY